MRRQKQQCGYWATPLGRSSEQLSALQRAWLRSGWTPGRKGERKLVLHPKLGLHADGAAPSRPPHARERLRGGLDVWGDDGDADDAERRDAVVEKRGEMRAHLGL